MRFEEFKDMLKSGDIEERVRFGHALFRKGVAVKKISVKNDTYNKSVREEQKRRYADQGEDISEFELEETSDPVTEDM